MRKVCYRTGMDGRLAVANELVGIARAYMDASPVVCMFREFKHTHETNFMLIFSKLASTEEIKAFEKSVEADLEGE